jgi:hypothetical protein
LERASKCRCLSPVESSMRGQKGMVGVKGWEREGFDDAEGIGRDIWQSR